MADARERLFGSGNLNGDGMEAFEGTTRGERWEKTGKPTAELAFWPLKVAGFSMPYMYKGPTVDIGWSWDDKKQVITGFTVRYPDREIRLEGENLTQLFGEIRTHICRDVFEWDDPIQPLPGVQHTVRVMTVTMIEVGK